ncbi:MAG TPA: hypothetical protein VEL79_22600 [Vicinamibacterales bacterium]|nr:hypothetical protein [Vicinamibacterales bacterium]
MTVRRELRFLRLYALGNSLVMIVLVTAAFRQTASPQKFDRISVQRLDVVDANGTLRMVISNKDHMHPGIMDGKTIDRPRPVAGMIFFNDEGDEVGGLTYTGREANGTRHADAGLMFDQLKQDQTIGLSYTENNRRRSAGLQVWDRSDSHLSDLIEKINAANKIEDHMAREAEMAKIRASAPPGPRRVFVGKNADRAATVSLADANGKPRLTLTVDPTGNPRIEFLDEQGKIVARVPQTKD